MTGRGYSLWFTWVSKQGILWRLRTLFSSSSSGAALMFLFRCINQAPITWKISPSSIIAISPHWIDLLSRFSRRRSRRRRELGGQEGEKRRLLCLKSIDMHVLSNVCRISHVSGDGGGMVAMKLSRPLVVQGDLDMAKKSRALKREYFY